MASIIYHRISQLLEGGKGQLTKKEISPCLSGDSSPSSKPTDVNENWSEKVDRLRKPHGQV